MIIPNLYIETGCLTTHPFYTGCLGFHEDMFFWPVMMKNLVIEIFPLVRIYDENHRNYLEQGFHCENISNISRHFGKQKNKWYGWSASPHHKRCDVEGGNLSKQQNGVPINQEIRLVVEFKLWTFSMEGCYKKMQFGFGKICHFFFTHLFFLAKQFWRYLSGITFCWFGFFFPFWSQPFPWDVWFVTGPGMSLPTKRDWGMFGLLS